MTCSLHRGAEVDLPDSARFYRREAGSAVAARFLNEFERVTDLLAANEGMGTPTGDDALVSDFRLPILHDLPRASTGNPHPGCAASTP